MLGLLAAEEGRFLVAIPRVACALGSAEKRTGTQVGEAACLVTAVTRESTIEGKR